MNHRVQLIRRLAHDFVQRCRMALANTGDDAAQYVDQLDASVHEAVASHVCQSVGLEFEPPPEVPRRKDGRKAPEGWAGKKG